MAFDPRELAILAYANGFTLWHYATEDPMEEIKAPGYFNEARELMNHGDMIIANADGAGAMLVVVPNKSSCSLAVAPLAA